TTLLNLILGTLEPDSGTVRLGANVQVAYFDQLREVLDPEATVAETISPGSEWVDLADGGKGATAGRKHVMTYLADFLFPPREFKGLDALRRRAQPPAARAPLRQARQRAGAGRADQRPRHRIPRAPRGGAAGLRRHHP